MYAREAVRHDGRGAYRVICFDEACGLIAQLAHPLGSEAVPLNRAAGCILAAPVTARVDSPPADCSAMDGYAVREADLPGVLRVVGEAFAGQGFAGALEPRSAVRIFTGAPIPQGADRVVIQEAVERDGEFARMPAPANASHVRRRGSDFRAGDELLAAGQALTSRALVAAAAADRAKVAVWRRPRAVVIATGDELAPPGSARRRTAAVPESVSYGIAALADAWGARTVATYRVADELAAMERTAGDALELADLIVVTGGASVGERDYAKTMFETFGLDLVFSKVAIKPGKPVWLGRAKGRLIMGLPGNPTSAMVTARLLLAPLVAGLSGRSPALAWARLPLAGDLPACGERETFVRAQRTERGALPIANQDSGAQRALVDADLLVRCRPHDPPRLAGEIVQALAF